MNAAGFRENMEFQDQILQKKNVKADNSFNYIDKKF